MPRKAEITKEKTVNVSARYRESFVQRMDAVLLSQGFDCRSTFIQVCVLRELERIEQLQRQQAIMAPPPVEPPPEKMGKPTLQDVLYIPDKLRVV